MIHFCAPVILASQYNLAEICVLEILSFSVCCLMMGYHQDYNPIKRNKNLLILTFKKCSHKTN